MIVRIGYTLGPIGGALIGANMSRVGGGTSIGVGVAVLVAAWICVFWPEIRGWFGRFRSEP